MPRLGDVEKINPLVEWFELKGLNGYKDLRLDNKFCVSVVAAENGSGKTTLLNALNAVLTLNVSRLAGIDFDELAIKLHGVDEVRLNKKDVLFKGGKSTKCISDFQGVGLEERKFVSLMQDISTKGLEAFLESEQFLKVFYAVSASYEDLESMFEKASREFVIPPGYAELSSAVSSVLGDVQVLYLPTFRRIEADFPNIIYEKVEKNILAEDDFDFDDQLIWFGMDDVEERIEKFKDEIKSRTFSAYSHISAQSLESLLEPAADGPASIQSDDDDFRVRLKLVLARLGQTDSESRIIELIDSGQINKERYNNLRSHLHQIISIHSKTQGLEQLVEGFVSVVNSYIKSDSFCSGVKAEKEFVFDNLEIDVSIRNNYTRDNIELSNLSSGEKQIVSLFCRLYVQADKRYIVLIDEPELSLAISWQQKILKDVLESPSCAQLIAITHSPFIFQNELDAYATPLLVTLKELP